jgi:hypothetical protein
MDDTDEQQARKRLMELVADALEGEVPGAETPVQEFEVGERVRRAHFYGTVVEYFPQVYADNLYRVAWDTDGDDTDLYPAGSLQAAHGVDRRAA